MAGKKTTQNLTTKKNSKKLDSDLIFVLSIFVLKTMSTKKNPLKIREIVNKFPITMTGESSAGDAAGRRLRERLERIAEAQEENCDALSLVLGGKIKIVYGKSKRNKSFYFEPLLTEGDIIFLRAQILSDKKLLSDQKDFIIERLMTLYPKLHRYYKNTRININSDISLLDQKLFTASKRKMEKTDNTNEISYLNYLKNIEILYLAIKNEQKIKITYGRYLHNPSSPSRAKFTITPKSKENPEIPKEFIVSPYDLVWNNGNYYLVGILENKDVFRTFRVDRIKQLSPVHIESPGKENDGKKKFERRNPLPSKYDDLKKAVSNHKDHNFILDSDLFLKTYPLMVTKTISDLSDYDDEYSDYNKNTNSDLLSSATILCDQIGFSILVDHFGTNLWSKPVSKVDPKMIPEQVLKIIEEQNAKDDYFVVTLHNLCFDGIVLFCLNFQASLTGKLPSLMALGPRSLVESVSKRLSMSLEAYRTITKK